MFKNFQIATWVCLGLLVLSGCKPAARSSDDALREANKTNIQRLANLYARFQFQNGGKGPRDQAELSAFIGKLDAGFLKNIGVDVAKVDALFTSERDSQPFDVIYGIAGSSRGSDRAIVFEKTGVDGKRQVGFTSFAVREYADAGEIESLKKGDLAPQNSRPSAPAIPPRN